jgi:hypothetical protein
MADPDPRKQGMRARLNERSDIVTRVESTLKRKWDYRRWTYTTQARRGSSEKRKRKKGKGKNNNRQNEWKARTINGYPVPRERHVITEQRNREGEWGSCVVSRRRKATVGEVVHAGMFRELVAAIVELGGGVTCRSSWYRG